MRWAIAAASLLVLVIGVALLIHAPDVEMLPPGGRAVLYIGVVLIWGFVAVGSVAWWRRPENGTGRLMVRVGVLVGLTALQFFDPPALFAIGVVAIWGEPIRRWIAELTGEAGSSGPVSPTPGPRL